MSASVACVVRLPVLSCVTEVRAETHRCRDEPAGGRLPPGMQPGPGEPFQRVRRHSSRRSQDHAVGADRRYRQRRTALRGLHQATHPALVKKVETTLCPAAEQPDPPADKQARDGRGPRVAGHPEGDPAGPQVLDHFIAEASLLQVTLERLVTPAPDPLATTVSVPAPIDDPPDPTPGK